MEQMFINSKYGVKTDTLHKQPFPVLEANPVTATILSFYGDRK